VRFRKCGKPRCHGAKKGAQGEGPSYWLTHPVAGKTIPQVIPAGPAVDRTHQPLEEYHNSRELVQQLIAVSEQICDLQMRSCGLPGACQAYYSWAARFLPDIDIDSLLTASDGRFEVIGGSARELETQRVRQQLCCA